MGPVEALDDGRPLHFSPRPRAVLAVLMLHAGQVVPATRLIDAVWADRPPETAANVVQGYVSQLRKALGRDVARDPRPGLSAARRARRDRPASLRASRHRRSARPRRRPTRGRCGRAPRCAGALAGRGTGRRRRRRCLAPRGDAARRAPARRARATDRGRPRLRASPRGRGRARRPDVGQSPARASAGAPDARPVSLRPPGGGARLVPGDALCASSTSSVSSPGQPCRSSNRPSSGTTRARPPGRAGRPAGRGAERAHDRRRAARPGRRGFAVAVADRSPPRAIGRSCSPATVGTIRRLRRGLSRPARASRTARRGRDRRAGGGVHVADPGADLARSPASRTPSSCSWTRP